MGGYLTNKILAGVFQMEIEFEDILEVDNDLVELVRNWRNDKNVSRYMYTDHYITKEEHQRWIENLKKGTTAKAWIIRYNGKPVGLVSLSDIDYKNKTASWGFYIADETLRGKGIGSATLYKLMKYVFDEMNFNKMHTMVLENNPVAMQLYEKFGFKKEETFRKHILKNSKFHNIVRMAILREEWASLRDQYEYDKIEIE
jgi:hypothetical protein